MEAVNFFQPRHIESEDRVPRPGDTAPVSKATSLPFSERPESLYDIWHTAMPHGAGVLEEIDRLEDVYNLHATENFYDVSPEDVKWGMRAGTQKSPTAMHGNGKSLPDTSRPFNPHFSNGEEAYIPKGNDRIEKDAIVLRLHLYETHGVGGCDRRNYATVCRSSVWSSDGVAFGNDCGEEREDSGNVEILTKQVIQAVHTQPLMLAVLLRTSRSSERGQYFPCPPCPLHSHCRSSQRASPL